VFIVFAGRGAGDSPPHFQNEWQTHRSVLAAIKTANIYSKLMGSELIHILSFLIMRFNGCAKTLANEEARMKKTFFILLGFTFCVIVPALVENYRTNNVHILMDDNPSQIVASTATR